MGIKLCILFCNFIFSFNSISCTPFCITTYLISLVFNGYIIFCYMIYLLTAFVLYTFLLLQIILQWTSLDIWQVFMSKKSLMNNPMHWLMISFLFSHSFPYYILLFFLQMRIKWTEISTVYAGPFSKNCNLRALKRLFKSFGPVQSMTFVLETRQVRLENSDFNFLD